MKSLEQNLNEIHIKADRLIEKKEKKRKTLKTVCVISAVSIFSVVLTFAGLAIAEKLRRPHLPIPVDTADNTETQGRVSIEQLILPVNENENAAASGRQFFYRNGLEVTAELNNALLNADFGEENTLRYLALNPFRRDGMLLSAEDDGFLSDFKYEGKTYAEYETELLRLSEKKARLLRLKKEGEILKYGKDVLVSTGVPQDDAKIDAVDRGLVWTEEFYETAVSYYDSHDPFFLSRYIIDGVFLSDKAGNDLEFVSNELYNLEKKRNIYFNAHYSRHDPKDAGLFSDAGIISGEIDGLLYILITLDDFTRLADTIDCSGLTFRFLPRKYYPDILTYSYLPAGFSIDESVTGYDLAKISFEGYNPKTGEPFPDRVLTEAEFYRMLEELIDMNKKLYRSVQFGVFSIDENEKPVKVDPEILGGLNYSGSYSALSGEIYVAVRYEDLDLRALRDLSLMPDISAIRISAPYAVADNVLPIVDSSPDKE